MTIDSPRFRYLLYICRAGIDKGMTLHALQQRAGKEEKQNRGVRKIISFMMRLMRGERELLNRILIHAKGIDKGGTGCLALSE